MANDAHAAEAVHQVGRDLHGELVGAGGSWHVGVVDADEDVDDDAELDDRLGDDVAEDSADAADDEVVS